MWLGRHEQADFTQTSRSCLLRECCVMCFTVVFESLRNATGQLRNALAEFLGVSPRFTGGLHSVDGHAVATHAEDPHGWNLDHGDRFADLLAGAWASRVGVEQQHVGHAGLPAGESLYSDLSGLGIWPRLDTSEVTPRPLARAERHTTSLRFVRVSHVGCLLRRFSTESHRGGVPPAHAVVEPP